MHKPAVHQVVAGFVEGDAISNLALHLRGVFRKWGYGSEIFCPLRHIAPRMRSLALDLSEHRARIRPADLVVFHFSIGSETVDFFRGWKGKKVLIYHNITPGHYYRSIYDERDLLLAGGRKELAGLAALPDLSLADSAFNAAELREAGYRGVEVMPIIFDRKRLDIRPDRNILDRYSDGEKNILFVGRVVPNKRFEDLIKAVHAYKASGRPEPRLFLVGAHLGLERYLALLRNLARELKLEKVLFTNHVRLDQLCAYYRTADLFLCMSEHEGFCIPLLEAMHFGVPVMAYAAAAVPETLGGSGVLFKEKDFARIAEMMDLLLSERSLREGIVKRQNRRLGDFDSALLEKRLRGYLEPWLPR